jgi:hypothetical protein
MNSKVISMSTALRQVVKLKMNRYHIELLD